MEMSSVIGITSLLAALATGEFFIGESTKSYSDAVAECRDNGSQIPLPYSKNHNDVIEKLLANLPGQSVWIDLQVFASGWHLHNTDVRLYDQGCFSGSSLVVSHQENSSTIMECYEYCSRKSAKYSAFQQLGDNPGECRCSSIIYVNGTLEEYKCSKPCRGNGMNLCGSEHYVSYRVLAINGETSVPPWDVIQTPQHKNEQCAAYYWSDSTLTWNHFIQPRYCHELLPSLCLTSSGVETIDTLSTWFQARLRCNHIIGHLLIPNSNQTTRPTWQDNKHYWTGVTALEWKWEPGRYTGRDIDYTNLINGQPDLSRGNCVIISPNGGWESSRCDVLRPYICESGNLSVSRSPVPPTLELSTKATPLTTASEFSPLDSKRTTRDANTSFVADLTSSYSSVVTQSSISISNAPISPDTTTKPLTSSLTRHTGIKVGASLAALIVIVLFIVGTLIIRRRQCKKQKACTALANPIYSPANDAIIEGSTTANVDNYELMDIRARSNTGKPAFIRDDVNNDPPIVDLKKPPVYATPDKGRSEEGVLIVDNDLYGDCQQSDQGKLRDQSSHSKQKHDISELHRASH